MANTRISNLTASASNLASTDLAPVVQTVGVGPVKMTGLQLAGGLLGSTTFNGSTVTTSSPVLNLTQTWNAGAVTFTGLQFNVTNTASAAGSQLLSLQVGGVPRFTFFSGNNTVATSSGLRFGPATTSGIALLSSSGALYVKLGDDSNYGNVYCQSLGLGGDAFMTYRTTDNISLGLGLSSATPAAQTISVQNASGTNIAGANLTIAGSRGTGTGAGGSIIFQVAPAGSSGTAQNAYISALTINQANSASGVGVVQIGGGGNSIPQLTFLPNSGNSCAIGMANSGGALNFFGAGSTPYIAITPDLVLSGGRTLGWTTTDGNPNTTVDVKLVRDAANTLALRNGTNAQTFNVYGSYTSTTNYQRVVVKTLREVSSALSGATYVSTIQIPAYALLVGVTTRVNTAITGATSYSVGDGTTANLWGNNIGIALNTQSQTSDFTAVGAVGAAAAARSVTLTANGSNFTGGVVEICLHYLTTEAD